MNFLKEIFEKYGISYEKVISKCESILEYDKYDEIESVVSICRENNMEVTGSMFLKKPDEVKKIIPLCRKFGIEATGSIFLRKASQLQDSIDFIMENYDDSYLKNSIVVRDSKHLSKVFLYLDKLGVLEVVRESASILGLKLDEIKERKKFVDSIGEPMVLETGRFNSVFSMSRKNYAK